MEILAYSNEVTPMPWEGDVAAGDSGSPSCAKTRPFRNRPQINSLDALGIRAESRVFRAAGLSSDLL